MQVLNIGVVYKAEPGEGLAALAARFYVTSDELQSANPDMDQNEVLDGGREVCVVPPVCRVHCEEGQACVRFRGDRVPGQPL